MNHYLVFSRLSLMGSIPSSLHLSQSFPMQGTKPVLWFGSFIEAIVLCRQHISFSILSGCESKLIKKKVDDVKVCGIPSKFVKCIGISHLFKPTFHPVLSQFFSYFIYLLFTTISLERARNHDNEIAFKKFEKKVHCLQSKILFTIILLDLYGFDYNHMMCLNRIA